MDITESLEDVKDMVSADKSPSALAGVVMSICTGGVELHSGNHQITAITTKNFSNESIVFTAIGDVVKIEIFKGDGSVIGTVTDDIEHIARWVLSFVHMIY